MNNVVTFPVTTFRRLVYDGESFDSNYPPCHITSSAISWVGGFSLESKTNWLAKIRN